jgi:HEPN domain-containing protein
MMPNEETRKKITAKWLEKGCKDLVVGKFLLQKGEAYFDFACFHSQQCAEKAVKAFLVWHNIPFRKIHDLVSLGALCLPIDSTLEETLRTTAVLSRYAVDARYPGEDGEEYTKEQTQKALIMAELVLKEIVKRLPSETDPKLTKSEQKKKRTPPRRRK